MTRGFLEGRRGRQTGEGVDPQVFIGSLIEKPQKLG